jgi:Spy/CpxP family protein refolding chaperone
MMRTLFFIAVLSVLATPVAAQARQDPARLREQIVQRFLENYRTQAALTDAQYGQLETVVRRQWEARRELQERERQTVAALEGQLRPGVAADRDSVTKLLETLNAVQRERVERLEAEQGEVKGFLDPVQRAQLVLAFARLERQVQQLIQQRVNPNQPVRRP